MLATVKRAADILEKIGVGALLVGIFQHQSAGYIIGFSAIYLSLYITSEIERYDR